MLPALASPLVESSPTGPGVGDPVRADVPSSIGGRESRSMPAGDVPCPMLLPCQKSHALTAAKTTLTSNQVLVCGCRMPPPRDRRISDAGKNPAATAAKMYVATIDLRDHFC